VRQAIVVKYLGPTDFHGSRVKATSQAGSVTRGWDDALGTNGNYRAAAIVLAEKFGWLDWSTDLQGGWLPDGRAVFLLVSR
jgi:hypothetical protein